MADTFKCAFCGSTFEKTWSDIEAEKFSEVLKDYNSDRDQMLTVDDFPIICDNCYDKGFIVMPTKQLTEEFL